MITPEEFKKQDVEIIYPMICIGEIDTIPDWITNVIYNFVREDEGSDVTISYIYEGIERVMGFTKVNVKHLYNILSITKKLIFRKSKDEFKEIYNSDELMESLLWK